MCDTLIPVQEQQVRIGIDPAVSKEGPVAPDHFSPRHVDLRRKHFIRVMACLCQEFALGPNYETVSPEDLARAFRSGFEPDPICADYRKPVGDCVGPLNSDPCIQHKPSFNLGLARLPTD